jgi:hypothetical protein
MKSISRSEIIASLWIGAVCVAYIWFVYVKIF